MRRTGLAHGQGMKLAVSSAPKARKVFVSHPRAGCLALRGILAAHLPCAKWSFWWVIFREHKWVTSRERRSQLPRKPARFPQKFAALPPARTHYHRQAPRRMPRLVDLPHCRQQFRIPRFVRVRSTRSCIGSSARPRRVALISTSAFILPDRSPDAPRPTRPQAR